MIAFQMCHILDERTAGRLAQSKCVCAISFLTKLQPSALHCVFMISIRFCFSSLSVHSFIALPNPYMAPYTNVINWSDICSEHLNSVQMQRKCRQSFALCRGCLLCMALVGCCWFFFLLFSHVYLHVHFAVKELSILSLSRWNRNHTQPKRKKRKKSTMPFCSLLALFLHVYVHYSSKALLMHQLFLCIFGCRGRARTISDKTRQDNQSEHVILVLVRTHTMPHNEANKREKKKNHCRAVHLHKYIISNLRTNRVGSIIPSRFTWLADSLARHTALNINSCSSTRSSQCCAQIDMYIHIFVEERVCTRSMAMTSARKNLLSLNVLRKFDMHVFAFTSFYYFTYFQITPTQQQYTGYLSLFLCT